MSSDAPASPDYPPDPPPFAQALPPVRPTSVTVIAICGIVYAGLILLGLLFGSVALFVDTGANPVAAAMRENSAIWAWSILSTLVSLGLTVLLLASAIGALSLRPWARRGMVYWAIAAIVFGVVGVIVNMLLMQPIVQQMQRDQNLPEAAIQMGNAMSLCGGIVFGVLLPAVALYFMSRPHVKAAFEHAPTPR